MLPFSLIAAMTMPHGVAADDRVAVVLRDIAVLQWDASGWIAHRDIVVRDTTITSITPSGGRLPTAKVVIDGAGKFAIPGLFDNRVDLAHITRESAGLFVAYGVTSVRDAGTDAARVAEWRRDIAHGKWIGPRLLEGAAGALDAEAPLAGSSARSAAIVPGLSLHEQLARSAMQGMPPAEVLRRATIESARFHGRANDLGSIEAGKIADMVILDGDPLSDISRTRAIDVVVFRGEALTRAHLNRLLSKADSPAAKR